MGTKYRVAYRLKDNPEWIGYVQKATLNTEDFGIEPTHGLLGSDEWWANIASGKLPTVTISGVISKVYMGSMGDWPMFEMTDSGGEKSAWTREANTEEQGELYAAGRAIELDYVVQRHRKKSWDGGAEHKIPLEVRIDAG
jgi:hypothetical protein